MVNPVDGKSVNRFYPGIPTPTQTERASWAMTKQVVDKSEYLVGTATHPVPTLRLVAPQG